MLLSSICRLSLEQLQEIFIHTYHTSDNSRIPYKNSPPLLFCHVCRPWRQLALATPELWCHLNLEATPESFKAPRRGVRKFKEILEFWLSRSKHHPLCFRFSLDRVPDQRWALTFPFRSNLRELEIDVAFKDQLRGVSFDGIEPLKCLEAVDLRIASNEHEDNDSDRGYIMDMYPILPDKLPSLSMLSLSYPDFHCGKIRLLNVPWRQMTHLCLHEEISLLAWHEILRMTPHLQKCYIGLCLFYADHEESEEHDIAKLPHVHMEHLQELEVSILTPCLGMVFTGVVCPNLTRFVVKSSSVQNALSGIEKQLTLCSTNAQGLKQLQLLRQDIDASSVLVVLLILPALEDLSLDCAGNHDKLLRALAVRDDFVPKLKKFNLGIIRYDRLQRDVPTFSAAIYADAIKSRWCWKRQRKCLKQSASTRVVERMTRATLLVDEDHEMDLWKVKHLLSNVVKRGLSFRAEVHSARNWKNPLISGENTWVRWKKEMGLWH
ncbi:hypothetical protein C0989_004656 [Termitomyces sp. Mn162]|nr:hypothetical protein C0989_004656 [Termitomyces sp. Mn162]